MKAGIVGLPNVGKSTLFNALTSARAEARNYPFCTIEPNVGMVPIPDPRLARLNNYIATKEVVPTVLHCVDIAGLVRGAHQGEGLGNQFLSHIREVEAILHVVRCFENADVTHVDAHVDPVRDIETIETELLLADLQMVTNALERSRKNLRGGDADTALRVRVLERCQTALDAGQAVRALDWPVAAEEKMLRMLGLITAKPVCYIANVGDEESPSAVAAIKAIRAYMQRHDGDVVPVCARIESELAELAPAERAEMLDALGMAEPALDRVARAAHALLGLQSFFTAGPKQIRAWTIPCGATAPQAAGAIHTDFERGFIRVEVYTVADLEQYHSEAAIKAAGRMRLEGKQYIMQDGDVCHFLFNV